MLPAFAPDGWLKLVDAEKVTGAFVVPTMLAASSRDGQGRSRRYLLAAGDRYGGGKMPLELITARWTCSPKPASPTPMA
jgi:hypothetical protein